MLLARGGNGQLLGFRGLGDPVGICEGYTWAGPIPGGHWERMRAGQAQLPGPAGGCPSTRWHESGSNDGGGTSTGDPSNAGRFTWAAIEGLKSQHAIIANERAAIIPVAFAAQLAQQGAMCPASSYVSKGTSSYCYTGLVTNPEMLVPGGFASPGMIGWHVGELKDGKFEKTISPDAEQRFWIDYLIAKHSSETITKAVAAAAYPSPFGGARLPHPSVNAAMAAFPMMRTTIGGFSLNPIQPTQDELVGQDGFSRWVARGGFPLSADIAEGRAPAFDGHIGIQACGSVLCDCSGMPSCIRFNLDKDGLTYGVSGVSGGWIPYFKINGDGSVMARLAYDDPSALERAGAKIADALKMLAGVFCGVSPTVKQQMSAAVSEKCAANGKACVKGTAGCKCVSPPTSSQMAVGASNAYMSHWCGKWAEETAPPVMPEPPQMPPGAQVAWKIPLWLVAIAGVGTGAFLFSRK